MLGCGERLEGQQLKTMPEASLCYLPVDIPQESYSHCISPLCNEKAFFPFLLKS